MTKAVAQNLRILEINYILIHPIVYYVHREITVFLIWLHLKIFWILFNFLNIFLMCPPFGYFFSFFFNETASNRLYHHSNLYNSFKMEKNPVISK